MLTCGPGLGGKMVIDELVLSSLSPNISEPSASPAPHDAPQPPRMPRRERPTHCQFRLIRHRGSAGAGARRAESLTDKEGGKKTKKANKQTPADTSPSRTPNASAALLRPSAVRLERRARWSLTVAVSSSSLVRLRPHGVVVVIITR